MNDYVISHIRTIVPILVGSLIAFLATKNVKLDSQTTDALVVFLTGATSTLYYFIARLFERYFSPKFGVLLGYVKSPAYDGAVGMAVNTGK